MTHYATRRWRTKSGSACWATPSWARPIRARSGRSRGSTRRCSRASSRSRAATSRRSRTRLRATATSAGRPTGTTSSPIRRSALFDNGGPNSLHAEPTIAAAEAGKHVLCEKPLGRDADESYEIWQRVAATGVKHLCGFNYRFVPGGAARPRADRSGRARRDPPLPRPLPAGLGRRSDASTRGASSPTRRAPARSATSARTSSTSPASSSARSRRSPASSTRSSPAAASTTRSRPPSSSRAAPIGTIEATRLALGRRNAFQWEINGSKGSLAFDMERLNELQVFRADGDRARGFKTVLVSETDHPFWDLWWPPGHIVGWGDTFTHEVAPPAPRDRRGHGRRPVRRDVRGRLPGGGGLRRDRPLGRDAARRVTVEYR